jgi:hypothetical protein
MPENIYFKTLPNLLPKSDKRYKKWKLSLKKRKSWISGRNKENDSRAKKISETFKRKKIDNFAKWRQLARKNGLIPETNHPLKKTTNLAFLIGLILGDGNINVMARTECLRITLGTDKPKLWKYTVKVIENVFNKKPSAHKRNDSNCMNIDIYQQNLSSRLGIPSGARKNLEIKLPTWIWSNKKMLISAIKGLFEAEGSFSIHLKTYTYNLSFSNLNKSLLDEVEKALKNWGFHPERRIDAVRLRRKAETFEFQKMIGFRAYPLV